MLNGKEKSNPREHACSITSRREGGVPCINAESNSININAHIPEQAGCMQPTTCIFRNKEKKFPCQRTPLEPWLVLASLPAVLKNKKRNRKSSPRA